MRLFSKTLFVCLLISFVGYSQTTANNLKYLKQKTPSSTPEIFAPDLISKKSEYEFGSVFNKAGTEFYYGVDTGNTSEIRFTKLVGKTWSKPKTILSDTRFGYNDPFLSPDEKRLYFISQRSLDGKGSKNDHDIWYVEKQGNSWSAPINAGSNINTKNDEYYISFTESGTMYFSSNKKNAAKKQQSFDIYYSEFKDGKFQEAVVLSEAINTKYYEADVFIDPKETYIIFCANRPEGLGRGDLYISFKNTDGTWTKSINMGNTINTKGHELCPYVSSDGKYFFYTSNQDIYWVSTKFFDTLRK
ncbi:WD40-like beta propeller repeat protein [Kordia sp. SMS9]|uniref:PD40 domain-containing protein n=1 Tax=Kordia sp. SMS9 TaxID=2282170 RepID=UPI000E0CDAE4|nr:PD40 domain-containing protein [Kordia sp. SMS9]AXG71684.1 WD40-like beta propeller repeat protein [Kordia sp. SMS9]